MNKAYRSYGFHVRSETPNVTDWKERIASFMRGQHPLVPLVPAESAELVIVLGGDGTLIDHVRKQGTGEADILALNLGHHGFLTTVRDHERFLEALEMALEGKLLPLPFPSLEVVHVSGGTRLVHPFVNDVLVELPMTWMTLRIELVSSVGIPTVLRRSRGSGLYLTSAIGSTTGVAQQFGAPVMETAGRSIYLSGICDRSTQGMLVGTDGRTVRITVESIETNLGIPEDARYPLGYFADGLRLGTLAVGDRLEIGYRARVATVLRVEGDLSWDRWREAR